MQDVILTHEIGLTVDHISHNTYDNRKQNLRIGTKADNIANRGILKSNTSGCTGVYLCKNVGKWRAVISRNKKRYTLGFLKILTKLYLLENRLRKNILESGVMKVA